MAKSRKTSADRPTADLLRRNPLIRPSGVRLLRRMRQHPDAPRWTQEAGDRIDRGDLKALTQFERSLHKERSSRTPAPPPGIVERIEALRDSIVSHRERIPPGMDIARDWAAIPTMSREDIALRVARHIPLDADLDRLIVYRTAGTTGHPIQVPSDPCAAGCYLPLLAYALDRYGIMPPFGPRMVACFLVGAQSRTVTYPTVLSFWRGAGFAKVNLNPAEWPTPESSGRYFVDLAPCFLTGDPVSFAEMMRLEIPVEPAALVTTAVALSLGLKRQLEKKYRCPVIDWYSLTETGPIGYACRKGHGYHILPHDLYVEAVDASGAPVEPGGRGEITVTGGRNPFLPLLRYRTGDWGRLDFRKCPCGDPMPRLMDLDGRAPVFFRASDGTLVNPVDVSRVLRQFPFVQHEFTQRADRSCELIVRPIGGPRSVDSGEIKEALKGLFGVKVEIGVRIDTRLGQRSSGKVTAYKSELLLED